MNPCHHIIFRIDHRLHVLLYADRLLSREDFRQYPEERRIRARHQARKRDCKIYQRYPYASLSSGRSWISVYRYLQLYSQLYSVHPELSADVGIASCRSYRFRSDHHRMSGTGYHEQDQDRYADAEI